MSSALSPDPGVGPGAPSAPPALPPPPRAADACPPDQTFARLIEGTLRDDEVRRLEAHCDACAPCGRTLAELARTMAPDGDDFWLGERYRLLEPLGAGGMGVVYAAVDTKLKRKVAVKRLRETGAGAEARRARFLREAQLLASLSHPNVLTVHDVGGVDGENYVVMELVDGWPMSRWISETAPRPGWREIVDLYLQVGRGLSAAHRLGVVHRDVKPENILVGRSGRVLIGDFGLAGLTETGEAGGAPPAAAGAGPLTQTGAVLGTPAYMAPELHDGKSSDARSDQFSFCTSLYESLHGRRPFIGQTAAEIAAAVRAGHLPLGRDGIPRAVDHVLATGLAADPARRHRSMNDLADALARARDRPALAPPRVVAGALAVAVAAGVAAMALLRPPHRHPAPAPPPASPPAIATQGPPAPLAPPTPAPPRVDPALPPAPIARPEAPAPRRPSRKPLIAAAPARPGERAHRDADPLLLLYLADSAHGDRDGAACLSALDQIRAHAWPAALAEHALRRRATCEMLRGGCRAGRRLLEPLDGVDGARAALLADCPIAALGTLEDRILGITAQADEARYVGNKAARRKDLRAALLRQTAAPEVQACLRDRRSSLGCGHRLAILARAYQVLAESFLAGGDCREGAALDVMQSQLRFHSLDPEVGDPALRCRSDRSAGVYRACAAAGQEAERRCVAHMRGSPRDGLGALLPELIR